MRKTAGFGIVLVAGVWLVAQAGRALAAGPPLPRAGWTATASSSGGADVPQRALDGSASTRWSSGAAQAPGQSFLLDMVSPQTFSQITLDAAGSTSDYARAFQAYVSNDGQTWGSPVATGTGSSSLITIPLFQQTARYLKLVQTGSASSWWSIAELNVYPTGTALSRTGWVASASLTHTGDAAANAINDTSTDRWSTGAAQGNGQWFQVDMRSPQTFTDITVDGGTNTGDYPRGYQLFVSNNGTSWGSAVAAGTGSTQLISISAAQTARYIRIVETGSSGNWWSISDLNVWLVPNKPGVCTSSSPCSALCPCDSGGTCGSSADCRPGVTCGSDDKCACVASASQDTTDPTCVDAACCTSNSSQINNLSSGADNYTNNTANACVVAGAGNDTLSSSAAGATIVGGSGNDIISAGQITQSSTPVRIFGGPGNDTISGWLTGTQIFGGAGDDTIAAGPGGCFIAPGSGADNVSSGDGDDTFVLYAACEATSGKKLSAQGGTDTLISPLSIAELQARGVTVDGFEKVIIQSDACKSDCTQKPTCAAGSKCVDVGGQAVCGSGIGAQCLSCADCTSGLVCANGACADPCTANPASPECLAKQCVDGIRDGAETDVDCGGGCTPCGAGHDCSADTDCSSGLVCGENNGACFGRTRGRRTCWKAACEVDNHAGGCGQANSDCGQNCDCVTSCDVTTPSTGCPSGETCKPQGRSFGLPQAGVCLASSCPSNDSTLCGTNDSLCGPACQCTANCSAATCDHRGDGCGGICPGVCGINQNGCSTDVSCPAGDSCIPNPDGTRTCRPAACAFVNLVPPLCGTAGALCGAQCPTCTASCGGRQCGADPNCGQSCGTCASGSYCSADGQCVTSPVVPPITVADGKGGTQTIVPLAPLPTTPVGAVSGQFSVSDDGSALYSIPIQVPPGRAGIEPALSLSYGSSKTSGDEGIGWRLEGLSKITRCSRSFALDGYAAPVKGDKSDLFCIDGKRLESVAGTGNYGDSGTQYRTLIDSFAKVVSYSDAGDGIQLDPFPGIVRAIRELRGPDYFRVWTRDGKILTFGRSQDSLVMARNGVRYAWLLNKVEDRASNTMAVTYTATLMNVIQDLAAGIPKQFRPGVVAYTGHGDTAGNRRVVFSYEPRQDRQVTFGQGGAPYMSSDRLSVITTFVGDAAAKNYRIKYRTDIGALSQVEQISECAGSSATLCKNPTHFDYSTDDGFTRGTQAVDGDIAIGGSLDLNGDGIPDYLRLLLS